jgi:hypothetical protein
MFTTGWAAPRRRSVCRTANVLALKSLLGRSQLLVAYAAVLSLSFTGTFISYLSSTLEAKRHCESRGSSDAALMPSRVSPAARLRLFGLAILENAVPHVAYSFHLCNLRRRSSGSFAHCPRRKAQRVQRQMSRPQSLVFERLAVQ